MIFPFVSVISLKEFNVILNTFAFLWDDSVSLSN